MEDHSVGPLLRELPREPAREGFTARVMARLDAPTPQISQKVWRQPRLVFAAAALAAVVASASMLQIHSARQEHLRDAKARKILHELRSEHDSLKQELQSLSEPVVYLGGNEEMDLVVDLSRVQGASF